MGGEAKVVPAEEMDKGGCGVDKALAASILKRVRPAIAAIKDETQRNAVADAIIASITDSSTSDTAKIMQAAQKNAEKAAASKPQMDLDAVQKAYDNMNPHRKETK